MHPLFERFCHSATMIDAELELAAMGATAVRELESFFTGEAKNNDGIPYRKLGLPMDCAIHVAARLGPVAKPLESHLADALRTGNPYAAMALRQLGSLSPTTSQVLAGSLGSDSFDLGLESAVALLDSGHLGNPNVEEVVARSERAQRVVLAAKRFRNSKTT